MSTDIALLDADPLVDIDNVRRMRVVVLRGRLFERIEIDALVAAVRGIWDIRANDCCGDVVR